MLFGARAQVGGAVGDLLAGRHHLIGTQRNAAHQAGQVVLHVGQGGHQAGGVARPHLEARVQPPLGEQLGGLGGCFRLTTQCPGQA